MKTKKERVAYIMQKLQEYFPQPPIPLHHSNPYTLLVAVLLSAQSTDAGVNKATPALFAKADNPKDMVKLSVSEIREHIKTIGLANTKSKNIHKLSEILLEKHEGMVPRSLELLEALPGVGHKTASVVVSQAFGIPAFPIDTHIHRMLYRWNLSSGKNVAQTEKDAKRLFPKTRWNDLHLQIIYYARTYSPARGWCLEKDTITKNIGRKSVINPKK